MTIVTTESTWVVGTMCHCREDYDEPPSEDGTVGFDAYGERIKDGEECDDHWQIWVAPMGAEPGRIVVADRIQFYREAEHIVALHNASLAVR